MAINNFGIGGSNAHLLLRSNLRKCNDYEDDDTPRLVTISGRTAESIDLIITHVSYLCKDLLIFVNFCCSTLARYSSFLICYNQRC